MNASSVCRMQVVGAIFGAMLVAMLASAASAQTVEEIIAKNLKSQGGRDALLNLKAVERKATVSVDGAFGQLEGTVEEAVIPWKKARRGLDLGAFVQKDAWNGTVAWREGMNGLQDLDGQEAGQIKQSADLNPLVMIAERGTKAEKLDDETVDDVSYYVVKLMPKDGPEVKLFIDKESGQLKRTTLTQNNPQFGEVQIVAQLSGYEEFGPVKLATKSNVEIGDVLKIETTFTETKVNGKIDESIFDKPEKPKDAK